MDITKQVQNDGLSCRWLIHVKSSLAESIGGSCRSFDTESSFIEMDPDYIFACWTIDNNHEVFLDDPPTGEAAGLDSGAVDMAKLQASSRSLLSSSLNPSAVFHADTYGRKSVNSRKGKLKLPTRIRRCAGCLKKMLQRCLSLLTQVKSSKLILLKKTVKRYTGSAGSSSRRTSNLSSNKQWCRSSADISIHDAILHCKRSNGQQDK